MSISKNTGVLCQNCGKQLPYIGIRFINDTKGGHMIDAIFGCSCRKNNPIMVERFGNPHILCTVHSNDDYKMCMDDRYIIWSDFSSDFAPNPSGRIWDVGETLYKYKCSKCGKMTDHSDELCYDCWKIEYDAETERGN